MIYGQYTIVLKTLLDDPQTKALIDEAMSEYQLYTAKYEEQFSHVMTREEINKRILDHFKYREIGFETIGRFIDELRIALNEIMPYYNQLFVSEDIINSLDDIFGNVDMLVEFEQTVKEDTTNDTDVEGSEKVVGSETSTSNSEGHSEGSDSSTNRNEMNSEGKNIHSETPQSVLNITAQNMDGVTYADDVKWDKNSSNSEGSTSGTTQSDTTSESSTTKDNTVDNTKNESISNVGSKTETTSNSIHRKGNHGVNTYAHDMLEFRTLFINIVQQIIHDPRIQELFMGVY